MSKLLVLMRGLPGSGKSYYARTTFPDATILSTDEYFMVGGEYCFDPQKLGHAHGWNQWRAKKALEAGHETIVIDNTHTQLWEMDAYKQLAKENGYTVEIHQSTAEWRNDPVACHEKQTHGVPLETVHRMAARWEE